MRSVYGLLALIIIMTTGCVQTRYAWNDYDQNLYNYYKDPAQLNDFIVSLKEAIEAGEANGNVPPGIYAEYGHLLAEKGNFEQSIVYFKKEHQKWPESRVLMDKMVANVQKKLARSNASVGGSKENMVQSKEVMK